ncbi:hypothetical protein RBB84_19685 [Rhodococcus sp. D-6]|uniref:DUF3263 domain-containing protein n=1 Tax=Rhodococcus sp. D-6 TaxID=1387842 RepID=A0AAU7UUP9_9NOCA
MDKADRHLVEHVLVWDPYGWPPADRTFVKFGMTPQRLFERCLQIVSAARYNRGLSPQEVAQVGQLARAVARHRPMKSRSARRGAASAATAGQSVS